MWHLRTGGPDQLRKWRRRRRMSQNGPAAPRSVTSESLTDFDLREIFPVQEESIRPTVFADITVGVIFDEFTMASFGCEWQIVPLSRHAWREQLDDLDFVFLESAWNGNSGDWKYQLTGESGPKSEVIELLTTCRHRGIPTVFWNKEDPPHFDDFLPIARLCDTVFTSDSRLVERYKQELGHHSVGPLPFAAQPAIQSPVRPSKDSATRDIAFAGMYFAHKFPERRAQMDLLLGAAARISERMEYGLEIFSRFLGDDERYQFPGQLADHVIGSLPYRNLLTAYKYYKVFLNVNSVVDSPSMCARRIFEIIAAGTSVVTTSSAATKEFFTQEELPQPETDEDAELVLRAFVRSKELRDRTVHKAQRRIWREHTYTHRAMTVMDALDVPYTNPIPQTISAVVSTNRPDHLGEVIATHTKQIHPDRELVLVTHGFEVHSDFLSQAKDAGIDNLVVVPMPSDQTLGECLNAGVAAAGGTVIAKMDDDDIYGENYLSDQLAALRYSHADLVGKQAHYLHLRGRDIVMCRFPEREHRFTDLVMGPTLMGKRELFEEFPFAERTLGEDTDLQHRLVKANARIYSADRFNFVQVRGRHKHTWSVEDDLLLANSDVHSYGFAPDHYCF